MTRFYLETKYPGPQMRFDYTCQAPMPVTNDVVTQSTAAMSPFNTFFDLSQVEVKCPAAQPALQAWRISDSIRYTCAGVVACNPSVTGNPLSCTARSTGMNDGGIGDNVYLDRHDVKCRLCAPSVRPRTRKAGTSFSVLLVVLRSAAALLHNG